MRNQLEPTLDDLLSEPIILKVIKRDGYTPDDVRLLMQQAHIKMNGRSIVSSLSYSASAANPEHHLIDDAPRSVRNFTPSGCESYSRDVEDG